LHLDGFENFSFFPLDRGRTVDALLILAIGLLLIALLALGGVIQVVPGFGWALLVVSLAAIAWRVIAGRRPV
jgi:hypothetical protein